MMVHVKHVPGGKSLTVVGLPRVQQCPWWHLMVLWNFSTRWKAGRPLPQLVREDLAQYVEPFLRHLACLSIQLTPIYSSNGNPLA
jgi:hypothetical protein